ncbi:hypothetical protein [Nostoc sp. ChiQUE01b]|nr:hypothetical protein [Nostoc sp. ChiQUE01b]MDZ8263078.1 hypothetical protein [Nostoc sp. ChiQUE01b]
MIAIVISPHTPVAHGGNPDKQQQCSSTTGYAYVDIASKIYAADMISPS